MQCDALSLLKRACRTGVGGEKILKTYRTIVKKIPIFTTWDFSKIFIRMDLG
jgi:hypothetical protein